jgi:hypothetical protein
MLKVSTQKVYSLTCVCGQDLANPMDGSLNWNPLDSANAGTYVRCPACRKLHKLPKALRSAT